MPWLLFLRVLLLAVLACQSAHATRQCKRCTFIIEDATLSSCSMCDGKLEQAGGGGATSSTSISDPTAVPGPVGNSVCGWPLNNGTLCTHVEARGHLACSYRFARHRECAAHSF